MPLRMIRVIPNDREEQPNKSVSDTWKGGVPLRIGNMSISSSWPPKWLANLTSFLEEGPGCLSTKKVAQTNAKTQNLSPIDCLCAKCDVYHLIKDCPFYNARSQPRRP